MFSLTFRDRMMIAHSSQGEVFGPAQRQHGEHKAFKGRTTTNEFMAHALFERMAAAIRDGRLGSGAKGLTQLSLTLPESHIAWASYEEAL